MKASQVILWCELFGIADPHLILHRTWATIDAVVAERNGIAHGRPTADEVGRRYSEGEIRQLVNDWHDDWLDFLQIVESFARSRDFYRAP